MTPLLLVSFEFSDIIRPSSKISFLVVLSISLSKGLLFPSHGVLFFSGICKYVDYYLEGLSTLFLPVLTFLFIYLDVNTNH